MKRRVLVWAAIFALVAASPALADRHDKDDASRDNGARAPHDAGPAPGDHRDRGAAAIQNVEPGGGMGGKRHGEPRNNAGGNAITPRGAAAGTGAHVHNRAFDSMRRAFTAPRRFQFGVYHRPSGWYSHRWNYGEFLPSFFFTRNYWILDWEDFALDDPPPGTVWVRYGSDALLIDEYTGEVIEVEYGIFY